MIQMNSSVAFAKRSVIDVEESVIVEVGACRAGDKGVCACRVGDEGVGARRVGNEGVVIVEAWEVADPLSR